ncbi:MAG: hypothetical protein D8M58_21395 [Calditrichaeota bacterium]|nr:MAG: hypothetical protein DWQ03_00120 [Calditrichota bacterium]MBL1207969.1 hypothetical protein [Calditrichota bacterium]NOG47805.1 hypothetical protein [Calditrichota bacterium]
MKSEAILIYGVYESVLKEILNVQKELPDHVMYLQPYKSSPIKHLRDEEPTSENPYKLFLTITNDLNNVHYTAEIIGWDNKTLISEEKKKVLMRLLYTLQPEEGGLYNASRSDDGESINLLHIRRLIKLKKPFKISTLVKTKDNNPVKEGRTSSGGWAYVKPITS